MNFFWDISYPFFHLLKTLFRSRPIVWIVFLTLCLMKYFIYKFWILILCQMYSWQRFSPGLWASALFNELYHFSEEQLSVIGLNYWTNGIQFRNSFLTLISCRGLPNFFLLEVLSFWVSHGGFWFHWSWLFVRRVMNILLI